MLAKYSFADFDGFEQAAPSVEFSLPPHRAALPKSLKDGRKHKARLQRKLQTGFEGFSGWVD